MVLLAEGEEAPADLDISLPAVTPALPPSHGKTSEKPAGQRGLHRQPSSHRTRRPEAPSGRYGHQAAETKPSPGPQGGREKGVDLTKLLVASGPGGCIVRADVEKALPQGGAGACCGAPAKRLRRIPGPPRRGPG